MGLIMIPAYALYFFLSICIIAWVFLFTRMKGKKSWIWAGGATIIMYNLVFWDWLPTLIEQKYYCTTQAGFWIYETFDEWDKANPGVRESLKKVWQEGSPSKYEIIDDGHGLMHIFILNDRFERVVIRRDCSKLLPIIRTEDKIIDIREDKILARYVDFSTGYFWQKHGQMPGATKPWLINKECNEGGFNRRDYNKFLDNFYRRK